MFYGRWVLIVQFLKPELEIEYVSEEDILTTSGEHSSQPQPGNVPTGDNDPEHDSGL